MEYLAFHIQNGCSMGDVEEILKRNIVNISGYSHQDVEIAQQLGLEGIKAAIETGSTRIMKTIARSALFQRHYKQRLRIELPSLIYFATDIARPSSMTSILSALISTLSCRNIAEAVHILNDDGFSAMHLAALDGHVQAAKRLLELGADPKQQSLDGNTALTLAIAGRHRSFWEVILPLSNVNSSDKDGDTPLMFAAWIRDAPLVISLLNAGADVNTSSRHGSTALWNAVYRESPAVVSILLQANADMAACCVGTHLFLDSGDNDIEGRRVKKIYPPKPRSLLWVAVNRAVDARKKREHMAIVGILLENGYDLKDDQWIDDVSKQSRSGCLISEEIPRGVLANEDLQKVLLFLYKKPLSLRDICRNLLREFHKRQSSHIPYKCWVRSLKLDKNISNFLNFDYLTL